VDGLVERVRVGEGLVSEVVCLEIMPHDFDVIEFGCVSWQPLDGEPVGAGGECRKRELADVDRAIVLDEHDGLGWLPGFWSVETAELFKMSHEVAAALGRAGVDDELAGNMIGRAEHRHFFGLSRRGHAQVCAGPCPCAGKIGMRQRLALVAIEKDDTAHLGLTLSQVRTQSDPIGLAGGLTAFRRVPGPPPAEPSFAAPWITANG